MHLLYESVRETGGTVVVPSSFSEGFGDVLGDNVKTLPEAKAPRPAPSQLGINRQRSRRAAAPDGSGWARTIPCQIVSRVRNVVLHLQYNTKRGML